VNLLLLEPDELRTGPELWLEGRRALHLLRVLRVTPGRTLRAGIIDGAPGQAEVLELGADRVRVRFDAATTGPAAPAPRLELLLALPRPKALRRVLRAVASLGVPRLRLLNAWRVEKSFFESPHLEPTALRRELVLGCEQGGHTRLPEVSLERLLRPFVEGLPSPAPAGELRLLCHPGADGLEALAAARASEPPLLIRAALGPEGGWVEAELLSFQGLGFAPASLGPHTLSTEVAVAVLVGQLQLLARMGQRVEQFSPVTAR
jgi:RsmE family RNA methyltransferase